MKAIGYTVDSTILYGDNTASIAKTKQLSGKAKHIAIKFAFVKEAIEDKEVDIQKMEPTMNLADIFIKSCPVV